MNKIADEPKYSVYHPTQAESKDIEWALDFKKQAYDSTTKERLQWKQMLERYNLTRILSEYDYVDDVQIGLTYDATERAVDQLPGREFGLKAKATGLEDIKPAILFAERLKRDWQSPDLMDGPTKMEIIKRSMRLFGTAVAQLYWDTNTGAPCFTPINLFDFYTNKFVPDVVKSDAGSITTISLDEFQKLAKELDFKNADKVVGVTSKDSAAMGVAADGSSIDRQETPQPTGDKQRLVKLFEVQTVGGEILTIALDEQPVWLRKIKNELGRNNFIVFRWKRHPLPNRFYGITDVAKGAALEDAIQRTLNQAVFNTLLVDNAMFTYDATDRNIKPRTFVANPGAAIPRGQNPNSITPLQVQSHLNESLLLFQQLLTRHSKVANIPDILAGSGNANTASQDNLNDTNAKVALDKVVDGMKGSMLQMWTLMRKLYEVYAPELIDVPVDETPKELQSEGSQSGPQKYQINKGDFSLERDLEVTVDFTAQNKALLSRRIIEFLQINNADQTIPPSLKRKAQIMWLRFADLDELAAEYEVDASQNQVSDLSTADRENEQMFNGQAVPPTPNASTAHTQRHVEFMRRAETGPEVDRLLQAHIEGELQQHQGKLPQPPMQQPMEQPMQPGQPMQQPMPMDNSQQQQPNQLIA